MRYIRTEDRVFDLEDEKYSYKSLKGAMDCANANGREIKVYGSLWSQNVALTPATKVDAEGNLHLLPR